MLSTVNIQQKAEQLLHAEKGTVAQYYRVGPSLVEAKLYKTQIRVDDIEDILFIVARYPWFLLYFYSIHLMFLQATSYYTIKQLSCMYEHELSNFVLKICVEKIP